MAQFDPFRENIREAYRIMTDAQVLCPTVVAYDDGISIEWKDDGKFAVLVFYSNGMVRFAVGHDGKVKALSPVQVLNALLPSMATFLGPKRGKVSQKADRDPGAN